MGDIIIRYVNMEHSIPAVTQIDSNGDYNIYINARLGYWRQQEAKEHELRHIAGDHFYRDSSVALDELEAEGIIQYRKAKQRVYISPQPLPVVPPPTQHKQPTEKPAFPFSPDKPAYLYHLAQWAGVSAEYITKALNMSMSDYNTYQFHNDKCPRYIRATVEKLIAKKMKK